MLKISPNKRKLQADATVSDQYITYPTDAKSLNSSRIKLDEMIEKLYHYDDKKRVKPRAQKNISIFAFSQSYLPIGAKYIPHQK